MREIKSEIIVSAVAELCASANIYIDEKILNKFESFSGEGNEKFVIDTLIQNAEIAAKEKLPLCQDTGMAVIFAEIGQDVYVSGALTEAINEGVRIGYETSFLRKSVVADPVRRINTGTNTPAVIHYDIVEGDSVKITVAPKGFGSENMSTLKMLTPSAGLQGVREFVVETVRSAGQNPCPPIVAGVGVGGTAEKSMLMAKKALTRELGKHNPDKFWADVEDELLHALNELNIGAGGFGGKLTALAVHINVFATHIAGLPVAVNIGCHSTRHKTVVI
ncbi:MAG: fumarate hydratase [Clostridiales bacterium]|jgi:fumarate hydratase subunit alpha|nr:fumarate hydratase [Clostridiales bacterium]